MPKSNYLEAQILNWVRGTAFAAAPATVYAVLSTADPGEDGAGLAEPSGAAGYARQAVTFGAPVQGANAATMSNSSEVAFGPATSDWAAGATTISHWALFDSGTIGAGNMLYHSAVDTPRNVLSGDTARFAAGQLTIGEQ